MATSLTRSSIRQSPAQSFLLSIKPYADSSSFMLPTILAALLSVYPKATSTRPMAVTSALSKTSSCSSGFTPLRVSDADSDASACYLRTYPCHTDLLRKAGIAWSSAAFPVKPQDASHAPHIPVHVDSESLPPWYTSGIDGSSHFDQVLTDTSHINLSDLTLSSDFSSDYTFGVPLSNSVQASRPI
jgi:hypothetical protein